MLRRCFTLAVSSCLVLVLGLTSAQLLFAQVDAKKAVQPPATAAQPGVATAQPPAKTAVPTKETPKTDATKPGEPAPKQEPAKPEAKKAEPAKPADPPIPPEVQVKIDAARKAVAEMIIAVQDAGLLETSIDPPPILDILITGRATDARTLKGPKPYGVSPEVFGAWFTGFGKMDGINYNEDVRITFPSAGLKQWYEQRARILEQYMQEARKAKGPAPAVKKDETKPAPAPTAPEAKKAGDAAPPAASVTPAKKP